MTIRKILIPISLGIVLPLGFWLGYRYVYPPISPVYHDLAQRTGRNERVLSGVHDLMKSAEDNRRLSDNDWEELLSIFQRTNVRDKSDALGIMTLMGDKERVSERIAIARRMLSTTDPIGQNGALRILWVCHAPEWRPEAEARKNSSDQMIRDCARTLLRRGEYVMRSAKK